MSDGLRSCPFRHGRLEHLLVPLVPPHLFFWKAWQEGEQQFGVLLSEPLIQSNAREMWRRSPNFTNKRQKSLARDDCSRRTSVTQSTPMNTISFASSGTVGTELRRVLVQIRARGSSDLLSRGVGSVVTCDDDSEYWDDGDKQTQVIGCLFTNKEVQKKF
jgi:hypothetical protein